HKLLMLLMFVLYCSVFSVLVVFSSLFINSAQAAGIYRWVDADGVTHYTESPPPGGIEAVEIDTSARQPNPDQSQHSLERAQQYLEEAEQARRAREEAQRKLEQEEAQREANCKLAR